MRAFVDQMMEDDKPTSLAPKKHTPAKQPRKEAVPPGKYDPTIYRRIRNARERSKSDGTVREFDKRLRTVAKEIERKRAA